MATKKQKTPKPQPVPEPIASVAATDLPRPVDYGAGPPSWARVPNDLAIPSNKQVLFLRFRSNLTDNPTAGHTMVDESGNVIPKLDSQEPQLWRQVIVWPLNVADKRIAISRALGDEERAMDELAVQMIRSVDGVTVNWGVAGIQDQFWNECGEKCRRLIRSIYHRLHNLTAPEMVDFFHNCVVVRSAGG